MLHMSITLLGVILPYLQKKLDALIKEFENTCPHPYAIGWKTKSNGLVMTRGNIACPHCGMEGVIYGGHTAIIPQLFIGTPTHWVDKDILWRSMFRCTPAERVRKVKQLGFDKPPIPDQPLT